MIASYRAVEPANATSTSPFAKASRVTQDRLEVLQTPMYASIGNKGNPKEPLPYVLTPEHQGQLVNKTHFSSQGITRVDYGGKPDRFIALVSRASNTDFNGTFEVTGMRCGRQRLLLQIDNAPVRLDTNLLRLKWAQSMSPCVLLLRADEHQGIILHRRECRDGSD